MTDNYFNKQQARNTKQIVPWEEQAENPKQVFPWKPQLV